MIEIVGTRIHDNDQTIYFTLTDGSDVYKWHCDAPLSVDPLAYITAKEARFLVLIQNKVAAGTWKDTHKSFLAENLMDGSDLLNKTPAQINDYINNNWTTIADSKATFKKLVQVVLSIAQRMDWSE